MYRSDRSGPDRGTVLAAREGDQHALDALVASCMPLIYNIVGRALDGHSDVDDVVQETLVRIVGGIGGLRDPDAFRSWAVAIAVRQVREREQRRSKALRRTASLDAADSVEDPASDFAAMTILRLGLTDQRREVAEATRWLDEEDRTLLALWWLEATGEISRAELAAALGLSERHTAVRVHRLRDQIETARSVVRVLHEAPGRCVGLDALTERWPGDPGGLWRKRFARHLRACDLCGAGEEPRVPVERLLGGLPLLPLPAVPAAWEAAAHSADSAPVSLSPHGGGATGRAARRKAARRTVRARGVAVALSVGAVVAAGLLVAAYLPGDPPADRSASVTTADAPAAPVPSAVASSASPSPSVSKKAKPKAKPSSPKPTRTAARHAPPAPAPKPLVASARKGVGVWTFPGVSKALADSGAGWYYTWSTQHSGVDAPGSTGFVPMIWGKDSTGAADLARARAAGPYLLGFNEPDMAAQSNMTTDQALSLWPTLEKTGQILGSPAVAYGGDTAGGWLDRFMSGAKARGYRVDFIALHWYGGDFRTEAAVGQLKSYLEAVHARYGKPVWLTEFALTDFSQGVRFPSETEQAAFLASAAKMLAGLPYVQRWAWFGLPAKDSGASTGLYRSGPAITPAGEAFRAAR